MSFATVSLVVGGLVLVVMLLAMWRVARDASPVVRIMAIQLAGSMGIAAVLLVGLALEVPGTVDIALVSALLAAVTTVAFARGGELSDGTGVITGTSAELVLPPSVATTHPPPSPAPPTTPTEERRT